MDGDSTLGDDVPAEDAVQHADDPGPAAPLATDDQQEDQPEPEAEDPPPTTGDHSVDEATAEVAATFGDPLETRLAAYERAHRTLQDRLADVEG